MLKTNEYFDGKVKSIAFQGGNLPATVGVMEEGTYTFGTGAKEKMTVISGKLITTIDGQQQTWVAGDSFEVAADSRFDVVSEGQTAYLCIYG
jgi:hypothetical protein